MNDSADPLTTSRDLFSYTKRDENADESAVGYQTWTEVKESTLYVARVVQLGCRIVGFLQRAVNIV